MLVILYCFIIGAFAGSFAGLLGVGGGVIVVPMLAWLFKYIGLPAAYIMHMATATALVIMVLTASSSLFAHIKKGAKFWYIYKQLGIGIIFGTIMGGVFAHFLSSEILKIIFAIFMLLMSVRMLFAVQNNPHRSLPGRAGIFSIASVIGLKSGMLGIGGGAITIPFLTYCNVPLRDAVITSAACSLTIAIIGSITVFMTGMHAVHLPKLSLGYIYLPAVFGAGIAALIFAQIGAHFSHKLPVEMLKRVFGGILLLMAIKMLI
ncbi:MAG: sulfite exporter TauE/SafE family protein [Gammaproteobacteria bacterium]|nr:sulfite exporter TauE/SafE family protein [Gammaproteobacteria bacterium]